jgi:hypothetical protein
VAVKGVSAARDPSTLPATGPPALPLLGIGLLALAGSLGVRAKLRS